MLIKMRESKGLALVKMMIVVAIIGILAAVAVPYYQRYVAKSVPTSLVFPATESIRLRMPFQRSMPFRLVASNCRGGEHRDESSHY